MPSNLRQPQEKYQPIPTKEHLSLDTRYCSIKQKGKWKEHDRADWMVFKQQALGFSDVFRHTGDRSPAVPEYAC